MGCFAQLGLFLGFSRNPSSGATPPSGDNVIIGSDNVVHNSDNVIT